MSSKNQKLILFTNLFFFIVNADQKEFVIVIPSYNNSSWYKQNLDSAISQNYEKFRIIYIDDASTDNNTILVEQYLQNHPKKNKVTYIKNSQREGALANYYKAIYMCNDNEIILCLDGDDWLADNNVLSYLNGIYQDKNVWITYGQYARVPGMSYGGAEAIPTDVIKNNTIRNYQFVATHLKTFYSLLFKKIKKEDLMHGDKFFPMAWDVAFMVPMLEMAGFHHKFIPKVLYCYNVINPISDARVNVELQCTLHSIVVYSKPKYQPLMELK